LGPPKKKPVFFGVAPRPKTEIPSLETKDETRL